MCFSPGLPHPCFTVQGSPDFHLSWPGREEGPGAGLPGLDVPGNTPEGMGCIRTCLALQHLSTSYPGPSFLSGLPPPSSSRQPGQCLKK